MGGFHFMNNTDWKNRLAICKKQTDKLTMSLALDHKAPAGAIKQFTEGTSIIFPL